MDNFVQLGTIKAQFPLAPGKPLDHHRSYGWCRSLTRPRITDHFIYIMLGHSDIRDNDHARALLLDIDSLGGHCTRLDFNVDYLGLLNFDAYYTLMNTGKSPIPSILKSPGGTTVYIGKRSSVRMLRVYDKRAEILASQQVDIGFDVTRIELEIKGRKVDHYRWLFMTGQTSAILCDIQTRYQLRAFCYNHELSKPLVTVYVKPDCFAFLQRYHRIIAEAYTTNLLLFFDILEVDYDV